MVSVSGYWYPAGSSQRLSATLQLTQARFELRVVERAGVHGAFADLQISQRVGNIPRKITLADHSVFETQENQTVDEWIVRAGGNSGWVYQLESRKRWVASSLLLVVLFSFAVFKWGLPWSSEALAKTIPDSVVEVISDNALIALDELVLEESEVPRARQRQLRARFQTLLGIAGLTENDRENYKLIFRQFDAPNAFALPTGTIVLTDELIELVESDGHREEIDSVLLHEIGHVVYRHGLQQIIRASIITVAITLIVGEPTGLEEVFVGLPVLLSQNQYSRAHESEADRYALEKMLDAGIDPIHFANVLERMDADDDEDDASGELASESWFDFLSTHPNTFQRINLARTYSARMRHE